MGIDTEYLNKIIQHFILIHNEEPYQFVPVSKLAKLATRDKFIFHVKYYIDTRIKEFPDVHFSDDYQRLYIG